MKKINKILGLTMLFNGFMAQEVELRDPNSTSQEVKISNLTQLNWQKYLKTLGWMFVIVIAGFAGSILGNFTFKSG
jgi:hypothetical protein